MLIGVRGRHLSIVVDICVEGSKYYLNMFVMGMLGISGTSNLFTYTHHTHKHTPRFPENPNFRCLRIGLSSQDETAARDSRTLFHFDRRPKQVADDRHTGSPRLASTSRGRSCEDDRHTGRFRTASTSNLHTYIQTVSTKPQNIQFTLPNHSAAFRPQFRRTDLGCARRGVATAGPSTPKRT